MGRYDNYDNSKRIKKLQRNIDKMSSKRNPDLYQIDIAQKQLDDLKLFQTCQIFGRDPKSLLANGNDLNLYMMFSDDNQVMWFGGKVIPYHEIESYCFVANKTTKSTTRTHKKGTVSRAIVGGAIAGGIGSLVGAISAGSESYTTFYEDTDSFTLHIELKDGKMFSFPIEDALGGALRKLPKKWFDVGDKLRMIIDENKEN